MPFQHFREGKSRLRQSAGSRRHAYGYGQNGTVGPRKAQEGQKHFNGVFPHVTGDIRREAAAQTLQFLSQLRIHGDIAQGRPPCAFRPESLHMAHSRMRRTEHNQTPGQFHPGQGRACNRAAVHISGMRQKNHQRMACPAGKRRSLSEQSGKSGGLPFAQGCAFTHERGDFPPQRIRFTGVKITRHRGGTRHVSPLTHRCLLREAARPGIRRTAPERFPSLRRTRRVILRIHRLHARRDFTPSGTARRLPAWNSLHLKISAGRPQCLTRRFHASTGA